MVSFLHFIIQKLRGAHANDTTFQIEHQVLLRANLTPQDRYVTIPDGVKSIASGAFAECTNLVAITMPDSVTTVGKSAFSKCTSLRWVRLSGQIKGIQKNAFNDCATLRRMKLPKTLQGLGPSAFSGCVNLRSIALPAGIVRLESKLFANCVKLRRIKLPQNCVIVGRSVFSRCEQLTRLKLPAGIQNIPAYTFAGCKRLRRLDIPAPVTQIGPYAMMDCRALFHIALPEGIEKVEEGVFFRCNRLRGVSLPRNLQTIETKAFAKCESLVMVDIPGNVAVIERKAFDSCKRLRMVALHGKPEIRKQSFSRCPRLMDASIAALGQEAVEGFPEYDRSEGINISSKMYGPAGELSNFTPRSFTFDGVHCGSLEGVLQSLKFKDVAQQREICTLVSADAKKAGKDEDWRTTQTLYWNGVAYERAGAAYQALLDRIYAAVYAQDASFRASLAETGDLPLIHSMGSSDITQTILTEDEFCSRLMKLRSIGNASNANVYAEEESS